MRGGDPKKGMSVWTVGFTIVGGLAFLVWLLDEPSSLSTQAFPAAPPAEIQASVPPAEQTTAEAHAMTDSEAAAAFPGRARAISTELTTAAGLIGRRDWNGASEHLDAASSMLNPFLGTSLEQSKDWIDLRRRVDEQRKRVQPELDRLRAEREAKAAASAAADQSARDGAKATEDARGPMPEMSPWNGSYQAVDFYLKEHLKDPDSYEPSRCSTPRAEGAFWVVTCSYRAKNSFGATVLEAGQFYIRKGGFAGEGEVARMEAVK